MKKIDKKSAKKLPRAKQHQYAPELPLEALVRDQLPDLKPGVMSKEELAYRKLLQGAIIQVSRDILQEQKQEVLSRAIEVVKKNLADQKRDFRP